MLNACVAVGCCWLHMSALAAGERCCVVLSRAGFKGRGPFGIEWRSPRHRLSHQPKQRTVRSFGCRATVCSSSNSEVCSMQDWGGTAAAPRRNPSPLVAEAVHAHGTSCAGIAHQRRRPRKLVLSSLGTTHGSGHEVRLLTAADRGSAGMSQKIDELCAAQMELHCLHTCKTRKLCV